MKFVLRLVSQRPHWWWVNIVHVMAWCCLLADTRQMQAFLIFLAGPLNNWIIFYAVVSKCNILVYILGSEVLPKSALWVLMTCWYNTRARFLSLTQSKLRLCSANHRAGYFSNLACDWLSIVWAYSEQETENGPRTSVVTTLITLPCISCCLWVIIWMMI